MGEQQIQLGFDDEGHLILAIPRSVLEILEPVAETGDPASQESGLEAKTENASKFLKLRVKTSDKALFAVSLGPITEEIPCDPSP